MRRAGAALLIALAGATALSACGGSGTPTARGSTTTTQRSGTPTHAASPFATSALGVVAELAFGNFAPIVAAFDPKVKGQESESALSATWTTFEATFGDYLSHGVPISTKLAGLWVERVPVRMAHNRGEVRITYDADGEIAGLYFLKVGVPI